MVCWEDNRPYLLGTNAEACWIGNSICAERSALTQLRWYPSARVNKIVIATDAPDAITPGMLCREFMASCDQIPWDTPIVLGGTICQLCQHDQGEPCVERNQHDFVASVVTLQQLYPNPSVYVRRNVEDCVALGKKWQHVTSESDHNLLKVARAALDEQKDDLHAITYFATVLFQDNSHASSTCVKLLEYGCSQDAVSQLAPKLAENRKKGIEPTQIVQLDQFGLAHPPFAPARAFLTERGYGNVCILFHDCGSEGQRLELKSAKALDLAPMVPDFVRQLNQTVPSE